MKICWDNLEKLRYSKKDNVWRDNNNKYYYMESCEKCGDPYLTFSHKISNFCSKSCSKKDKIFSDETRRKMSESSKGKIFTRNHRENIGKGRKGVYCDENHPNWKGGYDKRNIPFYDTYAPQIEYAEKVRRNEDNKDILEVKCAYCSKWFIPKLSGIQSRIFALRGDSSIVGEHRLYCSQECKNECPIYRKIRYPKGYKKATSREVQPELRQLVFERDKWICQKCGSTKSLHCHHIEGIRWEPLESADIDKCITYCKKCHKEVHKIEECRTVDMKCKEKSA